MLILQACEEKLRAELLEARVAPLRLAKAKAEEESEERKKAREASYRCATSAPASHAVLQCALHLPQAICLHRKYKVKRNALAGLVAIRPRPHVGL